MVPPHLRRAALLAAALLYTSPSPAADPQPYATTIAPTGDPALDTILHDTSTLVSLAKAPVGPFALVSRARDDETRLATALQSRGYYAGEIHVTIDGHPLADPNLPDLIRTAPPQPIPVTVTATRGPLFHLRHITLTGAVPPAAQAALDLAPGAPATADTVLAAQSRILAALQDHGYALAKVSAPTALLAPAAHALDVSYAVTPGPQLDLGPIALDGLQAVHPSFVRRRLLLRPGERYDPATIERARQDLLSLGVFSTVAIHAATAPDPQGTLPLTLQFVERPRNAVGATLAYSTDLGASAGLTYQRRNLFGNAERLDLGAAATNLGGSSTRRPGYDITAVFTKPDFLARDQDLHVSLEAIKESLDAYDRTAFLAGASLSRKFTPTISGSAGVLATQEKVLQEGVTRDYTLLGLPITAKYDTTGLNSLLEATHGIRVSATATPTASLIGQSSEFAILLLTGSTYINLAAPGRSILALRATAGTVQGASTFQLPPDQRLYAGGSATVRGFKYQSIGPRFPDRRPIGGTTLVAGTVEFRQRIGKSFGAAIFTDAGQVTGVTTPTGDSGPRIGAGVGARYYTPIGPIRLDVAVPINRRPGDDAFELYIGLGQAF